MNFTMLPGFTPPSPPRGARSVNFLNFPPALAGGVPRSGTGWLILSLLLIKNFKTLFIKVPLFNSPDYTL